MSTAMQVADSIVAELKIANLGLPLSVERLYVPNFELSEAGNTIRVSVVPREIEVKLLDRLRDSVEVSVDLAVQKKFSKGSSAEIDPIVTLVERIGDHFKRRRLDSFPGAMWTKTIHSVLYSPEHWEQLRQFTSLLTLVYHVTK